MYKVLHVVSDTFDFLSSIFFIFIFIFQTEMSVALIKVSGKAASPHGSCFPKPPMSVPLRRELRVIYLNSQWFKISFAAARAQMFPQLSFSTAVFKGSRMELVGSETLARSFFTCAATFISNVNGFIWTGPGASCLCALWGKHLWKCLSFSKGKALFIPLPPHLSAEANPPQEQAIM